MQSVCDRVALFNAGKIALMGTVGELGRQVLGGGYAVEVEAESSDGIAKRLSALPGVRSVEAPAPGRFRLVCERDLRAEAAAAVVAAGGRLKQLSLDQPSLEEHLHPLLPDGTARGGASCGVKVLPCRASAWWC